MRKSVTSAASGLLEFVLLIALTASACAVPLDKPVSIPLKADAPTDPEVAATLVVYNEKDPVSLELAAFYAQKRGIPFDHLIGLACGPEETITREEYVKQIAEPLRNVLISRGWWQVQPTTMGNRVVASQIRFVALMRGIPLRIAPAVDFPGDKSVPGDNIKGHNEAAVDSELAMLGFYSNQISGALENPYFRSFAPLADFQMPSMLLVCRLDAPDAKTVRRMIEDSIATEKTGLWGAAYIDARHIYGGGLGPGDDWMRNIATHCARHGIPCVFEDTAALFPPHYPMRNAALYFGWYSGQVEGPFNDEGFRFVPGAVAVHIHSFSGESLRSANHGWCAPLIDRGAAATLGNVYEPYLSLTPNLDVFEERLRAGLTFAEAAYASQRVLSWMTTFVGDPLYRPFKVQQEVLTPPPAAAAEWAAYAACSDLWFSQNRAAGEAALQAKGKALKSGIIFEGLGGLEAWAKDPAAALHAFSQAAQLYKNEEDQVRCALQAIAVLRAADQAKQALALTRSQLKAHPKAVASAVLRAIEAELQPPPSVPAGAGAASVGP